jgi:hypothetical protein
MNGNVLLLLHYDEPKRIVSPAMFGEITETHRLRISMVTGCRWSWRNFVWRWKKMHRVARNGSRRFNLNHHLLCWSKATWPAFVHALSPRCCRVSFSKFEADLDRRWVGVDTCRFNTKKFGKKNGWHCMRVCWTRQSQIHCWALTILVSHRCMRVHIQITTWFQFSHMCPLLSTCIVSYLAWIVQLLLSYTVC